MKARFTLFRRGQVYYAQDTTTGQQTSLRTKDEGEAQALLHSKNEAHRQPVLNLQIARTYLTASDPEIAKRTWQVVMDEMGKTKYGPTKHRHDISDDYGVCIGVVALRGTANVTIDPFNFVAKRWDRKEPRFLEAGVQALADTVDKFAADWGVKSTQKTSRWAFWKKRASK